MVYSLARYVGQAAFFATLFAVLATVLWGAAWLSRPPGTYVQYGRAACAAACMMPLDLAIAYFEAHHYLTGSESISLQISLDTLIVLIITRLPALRSLFTAAVYYATQATCVLGTNFLLAYLRRTLIGP